MTRTVRVWGSSLGSSPVPPTTVVITAGGAAAAQAALSLLLRLHVRAVGRVVAIVGAATAVVVVVLPLLVRACVLSPALPGLERRYAPRAALVAADRKSVV